MSYSERGLSRPRSRGVGPWGSALLSVGIGLTAVFVVLTPLTEPGRGGEHGYVLTTIGLTAIFFGIAAMRGNRLARSVGITASASLGIGLGAIASLAMLAVLATAQTASTGGNALALGPGSSLNGVGTGTAVRSSEVTLNSLAVIGRGDRR